MPRACELHWTGLSLWALCTAYAAIGVSGAILLSLSGGLWRELAISGSSVTFFVLMSVAFHLCFGPLLFALLHRWEEKVALWKRLSLLLVFSLHLAWGSVGLSLLRDVGGGLSSRSEEGLADDDRLERLMKLLGWSHLVSAFAYAGLAGLWASNYTKPIRNLVERFLSDTLTSETPLVVDFFPDNGLCGGALGMTMAPGKRAGKWCRSLEDDLDAVRHVGKGCDLLVTLLEPGEMQRLGIETLPQRAQELGMASILFSIRDRWIPESMQEFSLLVDRVSRSLYEGQRVVIHCGGGMGRTGMLAVATLLWLGTADSVIEAVAMTQSVRPGTIRNPLQLFYLARFEALYRHRFHKLSELFDGRDVAQMTHLLQFGGDELNPRGLGLSGDVFVLVVDLSVHGPTTSLQAWSDIASAATSSRAAGRGIVASWASPTHLFAQITMSERGALWDPRDGSVLGVLDKDANTQKAALLLGTLYSSRAPGSSETTDESQAASSICSGAASMARPTFDLMLENWPLLVSHLCSEQSKCVDIKPPTGFVAIVVTSVYGFSKIWEWNPSVMHKSLMLHNEALRHEAANQVKSAIGKNVTLKALGTLMMLTEVGREFGNKDSWAWMVKYDEIHTGPHCIGVGSYAVPPIIHRDLKSNNVLVSQSWDVKICDFGLSRIKSCTQVMTLCGTIAWAAPEILAGSNYSEKADTYSYGILMWEIMTGGTPYKDLPPRLLPERVVGGVRPDIPERCSFPGSYIELMRTCWGPNPDDRPTFSEIVHKLSSELPAATATATKPTAKQRLFRVTD
eukprot:m51a1_g3309 putative protein kinase domain containing protein (793) ;mRNA; f:327511-333638